MTTEPSTAVGTYTVIFDGHPARVGMLAQILREHGVEVSYDPPMEERGTGAIVEGVVIALLSTGSIEAIKLGIRKFRELLPRVMVRIKGQPEDDQQ